MFSKFTKFIGAHEDWLMGRALEYAQGRNYTKYTSTLKEAWRLSIAGLSKSLIEVAQMKGTDLELSPDEDYTNDPATQFGIMEAQKHKERGIRLDMFLGLMKYYCQSYLDVINESNFSLSEKHQYSNLTKRFFDRVEIGFCTAWTSSGQEPLVDELQIRSRQMTNEKNKYLTIFESLSVPVFIVDADGKIENMNHAASNLLNMNAAPGEKYYSNQQRDLLFTKEFPWMKDVYEYFVEDSQSVFSCEKSFDDREQFFSVSCSRSLDVSGKFTGTVVIIEDVTNRKLMEKELKILATTDPLTGVRNRRSFVQAFEQEFSRSKRHNRHLALLMMDIDHFKNINDSYGHDLGDKVLKYLAEESLGILRDFDLFGRWGGDEFIVLFPETDIRQAAAVAERLRSSLTRLKLNGDNGDSVKFTVSIGLAAATDINIQLDDVIKNADEALYRAKAQGRNRVVASE